MGEIFHFGVLLPLGFFTGFFGFFVIWGVRGEGEEEKDMGSGRIVRCWVGLWVLVSWVEEDGPPGVNW